MSERILSEEIEAIVICRAIEAHQCLTPGALHFQTRAKPVAHPRQWAMFLIRHSLGWSSPRVATFFGMKDHTTVLHAQAKCQRFIDRERPHKPRPIEPALIRKSEMEAWI